MTEVLQGDVKVPGIGKTKKAFVYGGIGIAGAYVLYRYYQARSSSDAPTVPTDTYATDPNSYGLNTAGGAMNVTGNSNSSSTTGQILSNADWTNQAVALLSDSGYDPGTVRAALGDFLARLSLDKTEATIARAALASAGQPPVGGPWTVIEAASTGTATPDAPKNLRKWNAPNTTTIPLQWDAVTGASHYRIYRSGLGEPIGDSLDTHFNAQGLQPNTTYRFTVKAMGTTGKTSAASNTYTAKTTAVNLAKPSGLKASSITRSSFRVTCNTVSGATYYHWFIDGRATTSTDQPHCDFTHLRANTTYHVSVAADTTNQNAGPRSSLLSVKTKK